MWLWLAAGGCPNPMGTARKKERRALSSRLAKARKLRGIKTNKKQKEEESVGEGTQMELQQSDRAILLHLNLIVGHLALGTQENFP